MSNQLKIKLSIANRVYPLNIDPVQEESLRRASKKIEEMIGKFEQDYSVKDKQDCLAMCALQLAAQLEIKLLNNNTATQEAENKLQALNVLLEQYIEL